MLTAIDGEILIEAFSSQHRSVTELAGEAAARMLQPRQWTDRFAVRTEGQEVLIPARLHFASERLRMNESDEPWRFIRALQTRSNDGFERQRAARDLLPDLEPWAAPFIVALIGEYIVEILEDISAALTPNVALTLGAFAVDNERYWETIKRRVTSYWNAYYRSGWSSDCRRVYRREEYVGFFLVDKIERAAFGRSHAQDQ